MFINLFLNTSHILKLMLIPQFITLIIQIVIKFNVMRGDRSASNC